MAVARINSIEGGRHIYTDIRRLHLINQSAVICRIDTLTLTTYADKLVNGGDTEIIFENGGQPFSLDLNVIFDAPRTTGRLIAITY